MTILDPLLYNQTNLLDLIERREVAYPPFEYSAKRQRLVYDKQIQIAELQIKESGDSNYRRVVVIPNNLSKKQLSVLVAQMGTESEINTNPVWVYSRSYSITENEDSSKLNICLEMTYDKN